MSRPRMVRGGHRWQPGLPPSQQPQTRRVAGRKQMRLPKLELPRLSAPQLTVQWRRAVAAAFVVLAFAVGGVLLYYSPLLTVRSVKVSGAVTLSPEAVQQAAGLKGHSMIRPDFEAARERMLALPAVKEAHISRDLPSGAHITIVERTPWGVWQAGQQAFVIDDEGVVLDLPAPEGAPLITQTDVPATPLAPGARVDLGAISVARHLVATAPQTLGRQVTGLEFTESNGLTVVFDGGSLRALFGDGQGYDFKLAALFAVLQRADEQGRSVSSVDLRFGDRVAVQQ